MSQLKKGTLLSYINIFFTNVSGLVLTPFIISHLGDSEYGIYTLIVALVSFIGVLDFGLNHTIVRFVAKYRAEKNKKGEENFLAITMLIYLIISIIVLTVGWVGYFNLEDIFSKSLTQSELYKAKIMFVILIFNLAITLPGGAFVAICSGYEHFVFPRIVRICRFILRSITVVALLLLGGRAISLVILDTIINLLIVVFNGYYVFRKLKVVIKIHNLEMEIFKLILSYSIWIFIFVLVEQFQWKVSQIVLGSMTNTSKVAVYAIGVMLGTYYGVFSTAISDVFLPRASKMVVENASGSEITMMMVKIGRMSLLVLLLILGGFILFGNQFVNLWVGENYEESWFIGLIIMIVYTVPLVQTFGNLVLEAKNELKFKAIVHIIFITIGLMLGRYLVSDYGLKGMIIGVSIGWMMIVILMNIYYQKKNHLSITLFFKELLKFILPTFMVIMVLGFFIEKIPGSSWGNLIIKMVLFFVIYCTVMYKFGTRKNEKEIFKNIIISLKIRMCLNRKH